MTVYKKNTRLWREREKKDCEMCGFTYLKIELRKRRGIWVCDTCYDEPDIDEIERGKR